MNPSYSMLKREKEKIICQRDAALQERNVFKDELILMNTRLTALVEENKALRGRVAELEPL